MIATSPADVLRFARSCHEAGEGAAMVTLTAVDGSSPRRPGAQMAVAADGRHAGSLSAGCVEAALVAEATQAIAEGRPRLLRFGRGSPYIDIRLPCGSGIDLLVSPIEDSAAIGGALDSLGRRREARLVWDAPPVDAIGAGTLPLPADGFEVRYTPPLRLIAIGEGEDFIALARLACSFGAEVEALTPDRSALVQLADQRIRARELITRSAIPAFATDRWTAIVFLFHDHDWEAAVLPAALDCPSFYIGAIGSHRAQAARAERLRAAGVGERKIAALRSPAGVLPRARDPATLALSILAEIVRDFREEEIDTVAARAVLGPASGG